MQGDEHAMKFRTSIDRVLIPLFAIGLIFVGGTLRDATAQIPSSPSAVRVYAGTATAPAATVTISPTSVSIQPGGTVQFSATVSGTSNNSIVWTATGGSMLSNGFYTAGQTTGTFKVTATISGGTIAASATVTIQSSSNTSATIAVSPGQSIQGAIDSVPDGSVILLKAGTHRMQTVVPKYKQTIAGEAGAILSGARLLTSFTREGTAWVASGQTQEGSRAGECMATSPMCTYPEDLFIDDVLLKHVANLSDGGAGKWYFDYANDKIYFWNDPTGHKVETSVTAIAFNGTASDVTIQNLIVEKFANPSTLGAIQAGGPNWTIQDSEIRWNHADGIRGGRIVRRNVIHHNGRTGVVSAGIIDFSYNELAYNNTNGFNPYNEAGGCKFVSTNGLQVHHNWSHHNNGVGLWTDIDNINTVYEYNTVEDNGMAGILHEVSFAAVIRNNTSRRNGANQPNPGWVNGAGIQIDASSDVEVYGNTVVDNFQGITGLDSNPGGTGKYILKNFYVHDNTVTMTVGRTGIIQSSGSNGAFTSQNNRYVNNHYTLGANPRYFMWMNADRTEVEWRGYGKDATGTFTR